MSVEGGLIVLIALWSLVEWRGQDGELLKLLGSSRKKNRGKGGRVACEMVGKHLWGVR